jgi:hypothetical protein
MALRSRLLVAPLLVFLFAIPVSALAAPLTTAVTGTSSSGQAFVGQFTPTSITEMGGALMATDTLTGTLGGQSIGSQAVSIPVSKIDPSCKILHLTLGPIDLDLLGLLVHVDRIVITITAQSGPNNLLGTLLCDIANLLNTGGSGALATILGDLNQILTILQGL